MNKKIFNKYFHGRNKIIVLIFCGTLLSALVVSSCKEQKKEQKKETAAVAKKDVYYTCSMHPQVHEEHPGNCPICGTLFQAWPFYYR